MSKYRFLDRFAPNTFPDNKIHELVSKDIATGSVRVSAASHPNATKEHLDKALDDTYAWVRQAARNNSRYKEYYPNGH